MNYIFDTSVIIDGLRQKKKARDIFLNFDNTNDHLFISSVSGFELFSGTSSRNKIQQKRIKNLLSFFTAVDLSWDISVRAGEIFREGIKDLEVPDYIIAASAIEIGAQVVTLNTKHFANIPGLSIYPL